MTSDKADLKGKHAFAGIFSVFAKLKDHPLMLAFLLNFAAFLFRIIFFDVKYEVSDDFFIDAVLSGAFGNGYDPNLLFGNVLLGYVLVFLYKLIPVISFYFILLLSLGFLSVTAVLFILFKKKTNAVTVCMAILFLCFITDDLYVVVQFTKASVAAGIAGGLLILFGLWEAKDHKMCYIISGILLALVGTMVRFTSVYVFAYYLVIAFVFNTVLFYLSNKSNNNQNVKYSHVFFKNFLICFCVVGLIFGLKCVGLWISNLDEVQREYNDFSQIRSDMTDKKRPDFESVSAEYERIGLDSVDYNMLKSWNFCDKKIYTDNLLQKVIGINNSNDVKKHLSFLDAFQVLINRCVFAYPVALVLYILTIFVCLLDKNRLYAVILLLGSVALLLAFVFYGRSVYRVDWGILYCAVSCVLAGFNYNETCSMAVLKRKFLGKEIGVLTLYSLVFVALILFIRFPRVFKISSYKNLPETEYKSAFLDTMFHAGIYLPDKTVFPIVPNKLHPNLLELTENDKEHFYYIDSYTTIQELYFNYSPWFRPKHGLFCDDYIYLGAVTMHHPGEVYALSANGCDPYNPFISITNKNVFFVDNLGAKDKLEYVRRYYYPNAELELIGIYDGFYVWNIYIPDTVGNK